MYYNGTTAIGRPQQQQQQHHHHYHPYQQEPRMKLRFHIANYYETYSENEDLHKGDIIKKIDEYDVRDLRHVDAQTLLQNSESVVLAVERSDLSYNLPNTNGNTNDHRPSGSEYHHHDHHTSTCSNATTSSAVTKTSVITCNGNAHDNATSVEHTITLRSIRSTKFVNEPQTPAIAKPAPPASTVANDRRDNPVGRQFRQIFKLLCARISEQLVLQLL